MAANRPAAFELLDLAAQSLRDDLVAKADANHRDGLGIASADEIFQRRDEGMPFIDAMARAGQQPAIGRHGSTCGKLHPVDIPGLEVEVIAAKQAAEHGVIIAMRGLHFVSGMAALQNADFHHLTGKSRSG